MIILTILSLLVTIGLLMYKYGRWDYDVYGQIISILSGIMLLGAVIAIPVNRYEIRKEIDKTKAFKISLEFSRGKGVTDLERISILQNIMQWNEKIAGWKYDNNNLWDIWIPDEVEDLKFIE